MRDSEEFGLRAAIAIRARTMASRYVISAAVGLLLVTVGQWRDAPVWLAVHFAVLGLFYLEQRKVLTGRPLNLPIIYIGSFATFAVAGFPAWFLWMEWGQLGAAAACLLLCGMLIELVFSSLGAKMLFWCSAAPILGTLVLAPLLAFGPGHRLEGLTASAAALLVGAYTAVIWRGHQRALERMEASRQEALRMKADAEAANRAKTDFLAVMSHEIRTPMNAVLGAADLLARTRLDADQRNLLAMLSDGGTVLMQVLDDVLDLSKIEAGKLAIDPSDVDLREFIQRYCRLWEPRALEKGLGFRLELAADLPPHVRIDASRTGQILFNLLSNALKFTSRGEVVLSVSATPGAEREVELAMAVRDTGVGMDGDALGRIFGAFEQADTSTSRSYGGTGLGLAISQKLAAMMGGHIGVGSAPGEGSTFTLFLPARLGAAPVDGHEDAQAASEPVRGLRILVAEDHPANQRIIALFLRPLEAEVTVVANGREALEALATAPFDVVLMDMQMPEIDGVEATRRLRASRGLNANVPVIALTANVMESHRRESAEAGMDAFVTKPIDARLLLATVLSAVDEAQGKASAVA